MAEQTTGVVVQEEKQEAKKGAFPDRRYVGSKESFGYVLFNSAAGFNINKYRDRFIFDVLKIDLNWLTVMNMINAVWDVFNDTFIGLMVDRTRTRWGKFKPYLVVTSVVTAILGSLFWLMPMFLSTDPKSVSKAIAYMLLAFFREFSDTFRGLSEGGLTATITPHPNDRTRLITQAKLWGNFIPTGLVEVIMGLLIDLINHEVVSLNMKNTYMFMGVFTMIGSAAMALYFFLMVHERVVQSVETPKLSDSIRSIIGNRPLLIIALSQLGGSFQLRGGMDTYYIDVLGSASIKNVVGIPGGLVSPISYTYVNKLKRRFSTKWLWIVGGDIGDWLMGLVFFVGLIGGKGAKGWYNKPSVMIPAITIQETLFMFFFGIRKVIPVEITNETMDYCEWKYGYRTEGMTIVALNLANKLISAVLGTLNPAMMKAFGYDLSKGFGQQPQSVKFGLFAMATLVPMVTGSFDSIAKLFYNLTGEKREQMYVELLARRAAKQKELSDGEDHLAETEAE